LTETNDSRVNTPDADSTRRLAEITLAAIGGDIEVAGPDRYGDWAGYHTLTGNAIVNYKRGGFARITLAQWPPTEDTIFRAHVPDMQGNWVDMTDGGWMNVVTPAGMLNIEVTPDTVTVCTEDGFHAFSAEKDSSYECQLESRESKWTRHIPPVITEEEIKADDELVYINIYLVNKQYGGPEEGGWYFDYGTFINGTSVRQGDAERMKEFAERLYNNEGRPEISSVLSKGRYQVVIEDHLGEDWPKERPHYE
jgi:hypothetical protein